MPAEEPIEITDILLLHAKFTKSYEATDCNKKNIDLLYIGLVGFKISKATL